MKRLTLLPAIAIMLTGCLTGNEPPAEAPALPEVLGCSASGPIACTVAPLAELSMEACQQLRACLADQSPGVETHVTYCEPPSLLGNVPENQTAIQAIATLDVELKQDGPDLNAVYLLVKGKHGWCPAAELLEPIWQHGGYCESLIGYTWSDATKSTIAGFDIHAERICRMPLDAEEVETGESDVAAHDCTKVSYAISGVVEQNRTESAGACVSD